MCVKALLTIVAMQGSSFEPCPVCRKAIATALLPFHVENCLEASLIGSKEPQSIAQQQQPHPERHVSAGAAAAGAVRLTTSLAQPSTETLEGQTDASTASEHSGVLQRSQQAHGNSTATQPKNGLLDIGRTAHRQPCETQHVLQQGHAQPDAGVQQQATDNMQTAKTARQPPPQQGRAKPEEAPPKAAQRSAAPAGNAFSHMMNKQKERAQIWTFYLGREENGRLFWHVWRDVKGTTPMPEITTHCSGQSYSAPPQKCASAQC